MATLNKTDFQVLGLIFDQVGEGLFQASPQKDGKGLTLKLTEQEEEAFRRWGTKDVLKNLDTLIKETAQKNGVTNPSFSSAYDARTRTFTTT